MTRFFAPAIAITSFCLITLPSSAEEPSPVKAEVAEKKFMNPNDHPATMVVTKYLNHALRHEWKKATNLIMKKSLSNVHRGWVGSVKKSSLTIDDEINAVKSIGKKSLKEVEEMTDGEFYAALHTARQQKYSMDEERLKKITNSLNVNVLSAGEEGDDLVHILVRTTHIDEDALVSNLELVSLRKTEEGWKVSLYEQGPKLTALPE